MKSERPPGFPEAIRRSSIPDPLALTLGETRLFREIAAPSAKTEPRSDLGHLHVAIVPQPPLRNPADWKPRSRDLSAEVDESQPRCWDVMGWVVSRGIMRIRVMYSDA